MPRIGGMPFSVKKDAISVDFSGGFLQLSSASSLPNAQTSNQLAILRHMRKFRGLGHLVIIIAAAITLCVTSTGWTESDVVSEYKILTQKYFLDRSIDFAQELLQREEYLGVLYNSTVAEIEARRKESSLSGLFADPVWQVDPAYFDRNNPALADLSLAERYQLWADFEDREFSRRQELVQSVRSKLIEIGTNEQNQRMFRRELEKTLRYYGEADWEMASLLFDRLLMDYPFQQMDDILFYQSEVNIELQYYDKALTFLLNILSDYPQSKYHAKSYERASQLLAELGEKRDQIHLYQNFSFEGFPGDPEEMGGLHFRAGQAEASWGHFTVAIEILNRIDQKSPFYLPSRYLLADCAAGLEDWPQAVDVLSEMVDMKQHGMPHERWRMLMDEAKIRLAFIFYEWGELDKANDLFKQISQNSPFYDRVLMGKSWLAFQLDNYEEAIAKSEELLAAYPYSTEIYEAGSLVGYCYEQMGEKSTAMGYFFDVLEAGVGQSKLNTFLTERVRIRGALAQLQALENDVFASDNAEVYSDYKRGRNLLELSLQRIGLAELLEANADMRRLVEERILLDKLVNQHQAIEQQIVDNQDASQLADFLSLEDRIFTLLERLKSSGLEQVKSTPLYYQEARVGYINDLADTLSARVEVEIAGIVDAIQNKEQQYAAAVESGDTGDRIQAGLKLQKLQGILDRSYKSRTLAEMSHLPVLSTRVDRWSDFSFNRYAMGGMEFDDLEQKYERLKQVENYLITLEEMIEHREPETVQDADTIDTQEEETSGDSENQSE
ncbi:MAG: hypothetical protein ABIE92_01855 [bacterium]